MKIKNAKKIDIESLFITQNTFREHNSNKIKSKNNFFKPSLIINSSVSNLINKTPNSKTQKSEIDSKIYPKVNQKILHQ